MLIVVLGGHFKCNSSPSHACSWNVFRIPGKKSISRSKREGERGRGKEGRREKESEKQGRSARGWEREMMRIARQEEVAVRQEGRRRKESEGRETNWQSQTLCLTCSLSLSRRGTLVRRNVSRDEERGAGEEGRTPNGAETD